MEGRAQNGTKDDFKSVTCEPGETWCFEVHTKDKGRPVEDFKSCWDPNWDNGIYSDFGCQHGQHCLGGVCYENATVCLCNNEDNCNDFLADGGGQTPHPYEPSTPKDKHKCYYGNSDDQSSSLVQEQECHKGENLCVRVTKEDKEDPFEFRSCWSGEYDIQYTRPGCYKGFTHCHITEHGQQCHNDTMICVCEDDLCNSEKYSSEAPPVTPGSGLFCYSSHHHRDETGEWMSDREFEEDTEQCEKHETFCMEQTNDHFSWRGCWSTDYEEGRYNVSLTPEEGVFCEEGQHCIFGECHNSTVCLCNDNLCNDFQVKENATTPAPVTMTTTNLTTVCYYGVQRNASDNPVWTPQICGSEETSCMLLSDNSTGFKLAACYDPSYNDGKYTPSKPTPEYTCFDEGEHCWDNECWKGQLCLCKNEEPRESCNNPFGPTPSPEPTTPGSGLSCWYGSGWEKNGSLEFNLTKQTCNINETMCIASYGDESLDGKSNTTHHFFAGCHDPSYQSGQFAQKDVCIDGLFCIDDDHHHHGPGQERDDPPMCFQDNVCTCEKDFCNTYNVSSTVSPGTEPPTKPSTMRCWFGEQHPGTGDEEWKVEVCQDNEKHCFQMVGHTPWGGHGFESRSCWDLNYEDEKYKGDGCYKGRHCHHEHCFDEATICICDYPNCNDWSSNGTVTTDVPVTDGSGVLCYKGTTDNYEATYCKKNETMCAFFGVSDGRELLDCYDPYKHNSTFNAEACYSDTDLEWDNQLEHGKFCVCDGVKNDLCNEDFFRGGSSAISHTISLLTLIFALASIH